MEVVFGRSLQNRTDSHGCTCRPLADTPVSEQVQRGYVTPYHDCCSSSPPAFLLRYPFFTSPTISDVWTTSFFTHGMKIKASQISLDFMKRPPGG